MAKLHNFVIKEQLYLFTQAAVTIAAAAVTAAVVSGALAGVIKLLLVSAMIVV
jgi:hypothetical protein